MTTQAYEQQIEDSDDEEYEPTEQGMFKQHIENQNMISLITSLYLSNRNHWLC